MTELTSTQQQVLVLLANGCTTESAAKELGTDRNTVSDWRRTIPEFQKLFAVAQYEQTLYWREQLQSLGTLAITCLKRAMMDNSGNLNLRAAVVVLDRITKIAPEQPELAGQPQPKTTAAPAPSRTVDPPAVAPIDLEAPGPHKLHNPAQSIHAGKLTEHPRSREES